MYTNNMIFLLLICSTAWYQDVISLEELLMYSIDEAVLLFAFQYDHEIYSFKLYKNCAEILMRIELNLYIAFSRMAITSVNSSKPWQGVFYIFWYHYFLLSMTWRSCHTGLILPWIELQQDIFILFVDIVDSVVSLISFITH